MCTCQNEKVNMMDINYNNFKELRQSNDGYCLNVNAISLSIMLGKVFNLLMCMLKCSH